MSKIESAVVHVLASILGRSPESVRSDSEEYAAYCWEDEAEYLHEAIDWAEGTFDPDGVLSSPFGGRTDFDGKMSIVYDGSVDPGVVSEGPLAELASSVNGHFFLPQIAELVSSGHIELEYPYFYGKVESSGNLVETATAMFGLRDGVEKAPDWANPVTDSEWEEMLEGVEDEAVRHHLSLLFQDAQQARSFGGFFEGPASSDFEDITQIEPIACWSFGEGQGAMCLAKVLEHPAPLPELGEPVREEVSTNEFDDLMAAATSGSNAQRLDALDTLLDHFDALEADTRNRVLSILGNPWTKESARAVEVLGKAVEPCQRENPYFVTMLHLQRGFAADLAGDQKASIEYYTDAIESNPDFLDGMLFYNRACEYGYLGMADEAFADLERAVAYKSSWAERAAKSDYVAPVKTDPRIKALLEEHA